MSFTGSQDRPKCRSILHCLQIFFCGICMGAADIIPGISGGTVAFIMGFYENLINSIRSFSSTSFSLLFRGKFRQFFRRTSWDYLLVLVAGIAFSIISLAKFFGFLLSHETYRSFLYSGFLGLVLAAAIYCFKQVKRRTLACFAALAVGMILAYLLTGSLLVPEQKGLLFDVKIGQPESPVESNRILNYDQINGVLLGVTEEELSAMLAKGVISPDSEVFSHQVQKRGAASDFVDPYVKGWIDPWIIFCGAIAICALLLPGISGSYLLTILGLYPIVIAALADFIHSAQHARFDVDSFEILFNLGVGIIIGALLFSHLVSWLLRNYHDFTISLMTGFMIGALGTVWPFWHYAYKYIPAKLEKGPQLTLLEPSFPTDSAVLLPNIAFMACGFLLVLVVEYLSKSKKKFQITN